MKEATILQQEMSDGILRIDIQCNPETKLEVYINGDKKIPNRKPNYSTKEEILSELSNGKNVTKRFRMAKQKRELATVRRRTHEK